MFRTRKTLFFPHFSAKSPLAAVFVTRLNLGKDDACAADTQSAPRRSFPARLAAADRLLMNLRRQKNRRQSRAVPGAGGVRECLLPVCLTLLWVQPIPPPPSSAVPLKAADLLLLPLLLCWLSNTPEKVPWTHRCSSRLGGQGLPLLPSGTIRNSFHNRLFKKMKMSELFFHLHYSN